jgi:hypothetical protein
MRVLWIVLYNEADQESLADQIYTTVMLTVKCRLFKLLILGFRNFVI